MTLRQARRQAADTLSALEDPLLEAELMLRHVTGLPRHRMILELDRRMTAGEAEDFFYLVGRRAEREPLQHLTGTVDFMGREFRSGPEALVPRPETEILTGIFMGQLNEPKLLADVGTGSGVMAVTLALEYPNATVIGTDASREALELARTNRDIHGTKNLLLVCGDLLRHFADGPCLDGIVANLPYLPSSCIETLQPEVRDWDPGMALDGGPDGLDLVRSLLKQAPRIMREGGILALELDPSQVTVVSTLIEASCIGSAKVHRDLTGSPRFITTIKGTEEI
ncbi:MAG: hypothetical protein AVO35_02000 [Candidatus Aegiribacteria sp. MLS_C]|nr:MAG: hypothetical protein AVO35_02000 [Candidatus Aegiribacteria sp. MLS_C]